MLRNLVVLILATWLILLCFERSMESGSGGLRYAEDDFVAAGPPPGESPVADISTGSNSGAARARSLNNQGVLALLAGLAGRTDADRRRLISEARQFFERALAAHPGGAGGGGGIPDNQAARAIYLMNSAAAHRELGETAQANRLEAQAMLIYRQVRGGVR